MKNLLMISALLGLAACGLSEDAYKAEVLAGCADGAACAANLEGVEAADVQKACEEAVGKLDYTGCEFDSKAAKDCLSEGDAMTCNTEKGMMEGSAPSCEKVYTKDGKACTGVPEADDKEGEGGERAGRRREGPGGAEAVATDGEVSRAPLEALAAHLPQLRLRGVPEGLRRARQVWRMALDPRGRF